MIWVHRLYDMYKTTIPSLLLLDWVCCTAAVLLCKKQRSCHGLSSFREKYPLRRKSMGKGKWKRKGRKQDVKMSQLSINHISETPVNMADGILVRHFSFLNYPETPWYQASWVNYSTVWYNQIGALFKLFSSRGVYLP